MLHTSTINPKIACMMSSIAYCKNPQQALNTYLPGWQVLWNPTAVDGTYAFVARNTGTNNYVVAVRGSLLDFSWGAFYNWIEQDLNVGTQVPWKYTQGVSNAQISQGSWDAFQDLVNMTDPTTGQSLWMVLDAAPATSEIAVVGHSLGGNLATVFASYLFWNFSASGHPRTNLSVCTFAAPAAGNQFFAQDFNGKLPNSMRFENVNDIVPKFPVATAVFDLGSLYVPSPNAEEIILFHLGYDMSLSYFFDGVSFTIAGFEYKSGFYINGTWVNSSYTQPDGSGYLINVPVSGKYPANDVTDWLEEAGYQHSINQYSTALGVPIITCIPSVDLKLKVTKPKAPGAKPKKKKKAVKK